MNLKEIMSMLKSSPMFWSRLGFTLDPVMLDESSRPVLICDKIDYLSHLHDQFYNEGVKVFTTIMTCGWIGVDKYDYTLVDEMLDKILGDKPDAYYMPRVKLNVPIDWCAAYPGEVFVYENGPTDVEEIRKLTGTEKHDWYGYESSKGYAVSGPTKGTRPNLNGVIGLQSYTSKQWLKDAGEAMRRFVEHLEGSKYAKQIIGYQIAFGTFGENVVWGCWNGHSLDFNWKKSRRLGDFSIKAQKAFWAWGLKKYKSPNALKANWNENVTEINCVPDVAHRLDETDDIKEFFRGYPEDKICVDYEEFLSDTVTDALCHFGKTVKDIVPEKAVGTFYGYIIGIANSSYSGHTMVDKLLDSQYIDFICAPKGYYRCNGFGPGLEQAPMQSFSLKKLWVDEIDNRTYLTGDRDYCASGRVSESVKVLWREYTKNLVFDQGFWWMDLTVGNFDSPELLSEIGKMYRFNEKIRKKPQEKFGREVLLVVDDVSMRHMKLSFGISNFMVKKFASDIKMCGTPVDLYRLNDLADLDLSSYKVVAFLDTFEIDDSMRSIIERKFSKDTVFIWNYAAGIVNGCVDFANTRTLTGFDLAPIALDADEIKEYPSIGIDFPTVSIKSKCKSLYSYKNGECMIGEILHNGRKNILCTLPLLTIDDIYEIIKNAGCRMYGPKNTCVYADSRVVGIFTCGTAEGEIDIGRKGYDIISGATVDGKTSVQMGEDDFSIYINA